MVVLLGNAEIKLTDTGVLSMWSKIWQHVWNAVHHMG